jgi:hypothetical protein
MIKHIAKQRSERGGQRSGGWSDCIASIFAPYHVPDHSLKIGQMYVLHFATLIVLGFVSRLL